MLRVIDIVINHHKKADDEMKWSVHHTLSRYNPGLIHASINAYGEEDERVGYDLVLQAEGGFMSINGTPRSGPLKMPLAMVDMLAAQQLKESILLALLDRSKSGRGAHISCSLF